MFERIIRFAIEQRWLILLAVVAMAGLGVYNYQSYRLTLSRTLPMSRSRSIQVLPGIHRWKRNSA